ncbi:hypothetical protein KDX36_00445 [Pseudomonas sp. CDFA 611]|nr:hypothetical protein [Pseudomonas quasicaspiana]
MDQYEEATRKRWKDSNGRIYEWNYRKIPRAVFLSGFISIGRWR